MIAEIRRCKERYYELSLHYNVIEKTKITTFLLLTELNYFVFHDEAIAFSYILKSKKEEVYIKLFNKKINL